MPATTVLRGAAQDVGGRPKAVHDTESGHDTESRYGTEGEATAREDLRAGYLIIARNVCSAGTTISGASSWM